MNIKTLLPELNQPQLKALERILLELIGEDTSWNREERRQFSLNDMDSFQYLFAVNNLRAELRTKVKDLFKEK